MAENTGIIENTENESVWDGSARRARWGASPEEWAHFDLLMGLGEDLLPVVSNIRGIISPTSSIQPENVGKVPSRYNKKRHISGVSDWVTYRASGADIDLWAKEPDYGICINTRLIRAFDIDIPDYTKAKEVAQTVIKELGAAGIKLPVRLRPGTGKMLFAFTLQGEYPKDTIYTADGIIEFLANGQQFIAVGTNPSGDRYEWLEGLPESFPELTIEQCESVWRSLIDKFETEEGKQKRENRGRHRLKVGGEDGAGNGLVARRGRGSGVGLGGLAVLDETLDALESEGHVLGWGREGQALIRCPFEDGHSTGVAGDSSTVYFPAGGRGYEQGHFKCLHASCEGRLDVDFLDAMGLRISKFDTLPVLRSEARSDADGFGGEDDSDRMLLPPFERDKNGRIEATASNLEMALSRADVCRWLIRFDEFRDEIVLSSDVTHDASREEAGVIRPLRDEDYIELRIYLERNSFKPIARDLMRDVLASVARRNRFDSAMDWLRGLEWDGVARIDRFLTHYMGADDTDYSRAVGRYIWSALAGRVLVPGIKADMVPILVGAQGIMKSSAVAAMAPAKELFTEISFSEKDDDLARRLRGKLIAEIGELRGLHTKEIEAIKVFTAKTHEDWVPKYKEFSVSYPRRSLFIGTTNHEEFLSDDTGNRRWLPVAVHKIRIDEIKNDVIQLWAEAKNRFLGDEKGSKKGGIDWSAERLAGEIHDQYKIKDSWSEIIENWLNEPDADGVAPRTREFLRVQDVLRFGLGIEARQIQRREEMRIGKILRELKYERARRRVQNTQIWVYCRVGG